MDTQTVSGIARDDLNRWLARHVRGARPPFDYELIAGGRSNLTYVVTDADGRRFVLRRPPLGHVLESAHDMRREFRIISALAATVVPVPRPLAFCAEPTITDQPFYVMEFVDGVVVRDQGDAERHLDDAWRAEAGRSLIDVLAALHALDPRQVGLDDLGRSQGYVERQLRRWYGQFQKSKSREIRALDEAHARLVAHVPPQRRSSIVHGDFRLGNCVMSPAGEVRAVLDWELCTIGDPLADVGWLAAYWGEPDESTAHVLDGVPTNARGFAPPQALVERYVERTGADVSDLDFYVALAFWKLACIGEGVYARYRAGVMGDSGPADIEGFGEQVERLAGHALAVTDRLG